MANHSLGIVIRCTYMKAVKIHSRVRSSTSGTNLFRLAGYPHDGARYWERSRRFDKGPRGQDGRQATALLEERHFSTPFRDELPTAGGLIVSFLASPRLMSMRGLSSRLVRLRFRTFSSIFCTVCHGASLRNVMRPTTQATRFPVRIRSIAQLKLAGHSTVTSYSAEQKSE